MQNLARFRTTSKFGGGYLRNGWRYSKSDYYSVYRDSSRVKQNKSGEVWFNDLKDLDMKSYSPKVHYSKDHISVPKSCCAPKFLTRAREWPILLAHFLSETADPLTIFFKEESKIALKCSVLDEKFLESKGVALWDFTTWRAAGWEW